MEADPSAENLTRPLQIEALANGGAGIARDAGRVIFIAGAFPGDLVRCRLTKTKKNYAEGEVAELLQPSPRRRIPPCPVADECGGCQWQQLPYLEQLEWKQQLFSDTLVRQAGVDPALIRPIVPSAEEFAYRSRVQIKCHSTPDGFVSGFFRRKSRYVVNVKACPLMPDALNSLLSDLRDFFSESPFAHEVPQIDLSLGCDGKRCVIIHYLGKRQRQLANRLTLLAEQVGFDFGIQSGRKNCLQMFVGSGELRISVDTPALALTYVAGGFAQINQQQNQNLVEAALVAARLSGHERVLDLYCGMGNFALPLARRAATVTGVEDYAASIAMAKRNAQLNRIENAEFFAMPAETSIGRFPDFFDLVLLDPPRAGAYAVARQLIEQPSKRIIYVSCDPQTLARDINLLLHNGYRFVSGQAFDMFPQTYHIESLSVLEYCRV